MLDLSQLTNVSVTDDGEGGSFVDFAPKPEAEPNRDDHNKNLAEVIPGSILDDISAQLLRDIEEDDNSRKEWLAMREQAIGLLGLKVLAPRSSTANGGAPFEGMSTYQDGALLEACVKFQANARGELLPASGPVKIVNEDAPVQTNDQLADALEKAVNSFLTVGATEYVPDHDRLFFQMGWSGNAYVKGYHCPLRRRPVIESIDAKDLIISAEATDIHSANRVTHRIAMSKATLIRMQIAGAYREVELAAQPDLEKTIVDTKIENVQGIRKTQSAKPANNDRTIYECYADYDIEGFEHKLKGKPTGLPIPYKFTIDKASRKILEVRRNWKDGDEQCNKRKTFVAYQFVPAFGFYALGLMNLMGNATNGITAAFRVAIDNGMINNFPYWLYAKTGTGQDKTDFRAGPGQGIPVNVPPGGKIGDMFAPAPTKSLDPAFVQIVQMVKTDVQRIGGTAEIQVGEGNQNAPVGTTIALIEQATKIMDAVHKRMHQAQAEEFRMLRELLQEDPEALWRHKGKPPFNAELIIQALNNFELTPQADPNVSSHMMRMTKAEAGKQLVLLNPQMWDVKSATEYYCDQIGMPELKRFLLDPSQMQPPAPPPGPQAGADNGARAAASIATAKMKMDDAAQDRQLKAHQMSQEAAIDQQKLDLQRQDMAQRAADAAADRQEDAVQHRLDLARELVIHPASPGLLGTDTAQLSGTQP